MNDIRAQGVAWVQEGGCREMRQRGEGAASLRSLPTSRASKLLRTETTYLWPLPFQVENERSCEDSSYKTMSISLLFIKHAMSFCKINIIFVFIIVIKNLAKILLLAKGLLPFGKIEHCAGNLKV